MRFGIVKSTTVWDEGNTPADRHAVEVQVVFGVDRNVLYEFLDALRPAVEGARREPILALLDYSARLGEGLSEEPIVSCKDCKHSHKDGTLCNFFASWEPIAGGDEYERTPTDVEPDGFCAWGVRRESCGSE